MQSLRLTSFASGDADEVASWVRSEQKLRDWAGQSAVFPKKVAFTRVSRADEEKFNSGQPRAYVWMQYVLR